MKELNDLNLAFASVLTRLEEIPAEDESTDDLVSKLQDMIGQRQLLLESFLASAEANDREALELQLTLTYQFEVQAKKIMAHRQSLLHSGSRSKRQINVYRTIDSNR